MVTRSRPCGVPRRSVDLGLQCRDLADDAARGGVEGLAFGGQAEGAGGALQQPHAEPRLQPGDQLADGRRA